MESKSIVVDNAPELSNGFSAYSSVVPDIPTKDTLHRSRQFSHGSRSRKYFVDGLVNGSPVSANVDSGASMNIISRSLADTLGLTPDGTVGWISLPTGKKVPTLGTITGEFNFLGEKSTYPLSCVVMEKTAHALVLGSRFLRITQTLTKYKSRIKTIFSNVLSLNLLGGQQDLLLGSCNDLLAAVVPDTGSDLMVMSSAYAASIGATIDNDIRNRRLVQFIDGSEGLTDGIVKDVDWRFLGNLVGQPIKCDFHIINNLPVNGIVSNAFLEEFDVFSAYEDIITGTTHEHAGVYGITLIAKCRAEIRSLESQYFQDSKFHNFHDIPILGTWTYQ